MQDKARETYVVNGKAIEAGYVNEPDSNLRGTPSVTTKSKPDAEYILEINKIGCDASDNLVKDNSNNTYEQDNYYCYNNGTTGAPKKLVQWKKVDGLWIPRNFTNSSEYKEVNNTVCKVITPGCDSMNPAQKCIIKCFNNDKTSTSYTANYQALPN